MTHEFITTALTKWAQYDEMYDFFLPLIGLEWPHSERGDYLASFRGRMVGAVEDYTISRRQRMLFEHWDDRFGGVENVPADQTARFNLPMGTVERLNAIGNLHQLPRLWWHLYSLAHVASQLHKPSPMFELDELVDRAFQRR